MKLTEKELAQAIGNDALAQRILKQVRKLKRVKNARKRDLPMYPASVYKRYVRSSPSVHKRFEKWIVQSPSETGETAGE